MAERACVPTCNWIVIRSHGGIIQELTPEDQGLTSQSCWLTTPSVASFLGDFLPPEGGGVVAAPEDLTAFERTSPPSG